MSHQIIKQPDGRYGTVVNGPSGVDEALDTWECTYAERTAAMRAAGCARGVHGYRRDPDGVWRCVAEPCRVVAPAQPGVREAS